jgi:hypothetical protein
MKLVSVKLPKIIEQEFFTICQENETRNVDEEICSDCPIQTNTKPSSTAQECGVSRGMNVI